MRSNIVGRKAFRDSGGILLVLRMRCARAFSWGKKLLMEGARCGLEHQIGGRDEIRGLPGTVDKGYAQLEAVTATPTAQRNVFMATQESIQNNLNK